MLLLYYHYCYLIVYSGGEKKLFKNTSLKLLVDALDWPINKAIKFNKLEVQISLIFTS